MKTQVIAKPIGLDHPSVRRVLEIAEEIMSNNKVLNVENLFNLAKKRLKIPRRGLFSIVHFLMHKKILIEGSKFSKETVLLNQIRRGIYNYIRTNPGVHFSILRKKALNQELGSSGQLVWHLEMLFKFNFIKKIKVGNYTVYTPFDTGEIEGKILFLLRDKINYKLIQLLVQKDSLLKSEFYKEVEEKRESVYYRIKNLINHKIITSNEDSDKILSINPDLKEIITKILKTSKFYIVGK